MRASMNHRVYQVTTLCFSVIIASSAGALGAFTPYWFDGFDVSMNTTDINFEIGSPRQGGAAVPTSYAANSSDYHVQMFGGGGPLQLATDINAPFPAHTMVSPDLNFVGLAGGDVIGKKIDVTMDTFTNNSGGIYFTQSAITIGSDTQLTQSNTAAAGFSVVFIEDTFGGFGNFIQIYDGDVLLDNLIPNPAGAGPGAVEMFVDDPTDGNPWDGIGQTDIGVAVNGMPIGNYSIGAGGYTNNFITLEGSDQKNGVQLGVHTFDNLTVYTAPVPEPASIALAAVLFGLATGSRVLRLRKGLY